MKYKQPSTNTFYTNIAYQKALALIVQIANFELSEDEADCEDDHETLLSLQSQAQRILQEDEKAK